MTLETRLRGMSYDDIKEAWTSRLYFDLSLSVTEITTGWFMLQEFVWEYFFEEHYDEYMTEIEGDYV